MDIFEGRFAEQPEPGHLTLVHEPDIDVSSTCAVFGPPRSSTHIPAPKPTPPPTHRVVPYANGLHYPSKRAQIRPIRCYMELKLAREPAWQRVCSECAASVQGRALDWGRGKAERNRLGVAQPLTRRRPRRLPSAGMAGVVATTRSALAPCRSSRALGLHYVPSHGEFDDDMYGFG